MAQSPPEGVPHVAPYLLYEDAGAALDYLVRVFGFTETVRMPGPDGPVTHAEIRMGPGMVMLGHPGGDYQAPATIGANTTQLTYVYVDDVDAHYDRAKAAGATITREIADQFYGDRTYSAVDPEGHAWHFATHVRDVPAEEMREHM